MSKEIEKSTLYIIQGFIGAGKTTFSKKLANETGAIYFNPDEWVTKLYSKEEYMKNWDICFEEVLKILWLKIKQHLKSGEDVVFDMGFWLKKDRDCARQIACECNSICKHYYLYVPDKILKERIIMNRPPEWAIIHLKNFDKNKSKFEVPTLDENAIVINNF